MAGVCLVCSGIYVSSAQTLMITFVRYILLLSSIIPISLRVNVDLAKLVYSMRINRDKDIEGCIVRNSSIPEELGRIEHLLCDKTGTLTQNIMIFKKLATTISTFSEESLPELENYIKKNISRSPTTCSEYPLTNKRDKMAVFRDLMTACMVCHNVTPTIDNGERVLQASSPDEVALVKFGESLNYELTKRTTNSIELKNPLGHLEQYEILQNFPFSSERKRMGILVKDLVSGKYIFYLKGADAVIKDKVGKIDASWLNEECENLAKDGLRTLVISQKVLSEEQFQEWTEKYNQAGRDIKRRDELEEKCVEELENKMDLLGISGVEDLLQEDIKTVVQSLRDAGIKVWMLTGDKMETAKCIAISTGLKTNTQQFFELKDFSDENEFKWRLEQYQKDARDVIIIEGETLAKVCLLPG